LGEILEYRNRWEEASEAFRQGIALSPRYATGHQWYSYDLMDRNRWDEAIREMERARELDPLSLVIVVSLAIAYDGGDRGADATPLYDQAQALDPEHPLTLVFLVIHDLVLGRIEAAASTYRRLRIATGTDSVGAAEIERRWRDPGLRKEALHEIMVKGPYSESGVVLARVLDGDEAAITYLSTLMKSPRRDVVNKEILLCFLGPRLRANPRVWDILVQSGYPRPKAKQ
jgi:tetratricopeptide (TPR) repeat protein